MLDYKHTRGSYKCRAYSLIKLDKKCHILIIRNRFLLAFVINADTVNIYELSVLVFLFVTNIDEDC